MRLFVAIFPSPPFLLPRAVADMAAAHGTGVPLAKNLHLTLAYMGNQPNENEIDSCLSTVVEKMNLHAFSLVADRCSLLGDCLVALVRQEPALLKLAENIRECLEEAGYYRRELPFLPHITLARHWRAEWGVPDEKIHLSVTVESFCLCRSERRSQGICYTVLKEYPLI